MLQYIAPSPYPIPFTPLKRAGFFSAKYGNIFCCASYLGLECSGMFTWSNFVPIPPLEGVPLSQNAVCFLRLWVTSELVLGGKSLEQGHGPETKNGPYLGLCGPNYNSGTCTLRGLAALWSWFLSPYIDGEACKGLHETAGVGHW